MIDLSKDRETMTPYIFILEDMLKLHPQRTVVFADKEWAKRDLDDFLEISEQNGTETARNKKEEINNSQDKPACKLYTVYK